MSDDTDDRTASLMTPAKLAKLKLGAKPVTPTAYLDQLAADAGSGHARRLADLRQQLESQQRDRNYAPIVTAVRVLRDELPKLDFSLLQPKGWLARATGKGKETAAGFVAQHDRIVLALEDLREELNRLARKNETQLAASTATFSEFDTETRAIEKIIDQGSRWLQDMRNQLRMRQMQSPDAAAQKKIDEDTRRCELLVARIKQLRGANSAAQHAREICATQDARRVAFLQAMERVAATAAGAWQAALQPVAAEAAQSGSGGHGMDAAKEAQEALQVALGQADRDGAQIRAHENALIEELAALAKPLEAAA